MLQPMSGRLILVLGVAVALAAGLVARLFVWPVSSRPIPSDAIVVLAGGQGERLPRAVALMQRGFAPTLVISNGGARGWVLGNELCGDPQSFEVVCPSSATTRGEAQVIARLARERGWSRVTVVTSKYHVRRASLLVHRCVPRRTTVRVVGAGPPSRFRSWFAVPHELGGLAEAIAAHRSC